jgi:hypothetical protein
VKISQATYGKIHVQSILFLHYPHVIFSVYASPIQFANGDEDNEIDSVVQIS